MSDAMEHDVMTVDLEDGIPTEDVPLETVESGLENDSDLVRAQAATVASGLVKGGDDSVVAIMPTLIDSLTDDHRVVVFQSAVALSNLAEDAPGRLEPAVPDLIDLLHHDLPLVRTLAARSLGYVALDHPELLTGHVEALLTATTDKPEAILDPDGLEGEVATSGDDEQLMLVNREGRVQQVLAREIAANLLVEVAEHDPETLTAHVDRFVDLLSDDDVTVATASADVVGTIAEHDPEAAADAVDPLCDLLDREAEGLVATAVTALGFIGDDDAVEPLRTLAETDETDHSEDLRDLAAETAAFLED